VGFVPLSLYAGPVYYRFQAAVNAPANNPVFAAVQDAGAVGGQIQAGTSNPNVLVNIPADVTEHEGTFQAPRAPVIFICKASATAGGTTFGLEVTAQQAA
jgi:hypothetical protein